MPCIFTSLSGPVNFNLNNTDGKVLDALLLSISKAEFATLSAVYLQLRAADRVPDEKLIRTKAETYTEEIHNGLIRHFLARFRRKNNCYSEFEKVIK
jgi:IS1 family transposase